MRLKLSFLITLLSFILIPQKIWAQFKTTVTLTIDTKCSCDNITDKGIDGKFGIYAYNVAVPKYSNNFTDTLVKELAVKKEQTISLPQGNYKLVYTPSDTLKKKNEHYIFSQKVDLNCYFFNKSHSSLIRQMGKQDMLVFSSTYFGKTNDDSIIPTHTTTIYKKGKKYYVSYIKTECKSFHISYIDIRPGNSVKSKFSLPESKHVLTEEQLKLIIKFEKNLWMLAKNNNLGQGTIAKSSVKLNNKQIHFRSKGYVSLVLWNEISKTITSTK